MRLTPSEFAGVSDARAESAAQVCSQCGAERQYPMPIKELFCGRCENYTRCPECTFCVECFADDEVPCSCKNCKSGSTNHV